MHFMGEKFGGEDYIARFNYYAENKNQINESIERMMLEGMAFELIDGENLDYKGEIIQEVLQENTAN